MKKLLLFFLKDGSLTQRGADVLGITGILIGWILYFSSIRSGLIFWVGLLLAIGLGYLGAWGGLSAKWGLKPFTNDPLGWRRVKAENKAKDDAENKVKQEAEKDAHKK
jgi:hypothetical protein